MGFFEEFDAATNLLGKFLSFLGLYNSKERMCDDYYYEEYNKKVFIRKNGDGLIVSSCRLKVIDPIKTDNLVRTLDISDAKRSSHFKPFNDMLNAPMDNIFSDYGFWYRSENDIVMEVEEYYDSVDSMRRCDTKFIGIRFKIDTTRLEKNRSYKIVYAFSVPGLYPIHKGRFDTSEQDRKNYPDFKSRVFTERIGHHLRFAVYFEDGIDIKEKPSGNMVLSSSVRKTKKNKDKVYNCIFKDNIFYKKYHFEVEDPQDYTDIYLKWNIKNPS